MLTHSRGQRLSTLQPAAPSVEKSFTVASLFDPLGRITAHSVETQSTPDEFHPYRWVADPCKTRK
jgi:hypothetical protein